MPLASGGVQTLSRSIQNKLLVVPSTTKPSVFNIKASSAPDSAAWARARICGSLLAFLNCASGSPAGSRTDEVTSLNCDKLESGFPETGCKVITNVGVFAPFGE